MKVAVIIRVTARKLYSIRDIYLFIYLFIDSYNVQAGGQ